MSRLRWSVVAVSVGVLLAHGSSVIGNGDASTGASHVVEVARLSNPDLEPEAWLDRPAVYGDTVVVGAHGDDLEDLGLENAGSAHVFVRDGHSWSYQQMLTAPDAAERDGFGGATAIFGDTIVVGAGGPCCFEAPGAAYVFVRTDGTWIFQQKLTPDESLDGAHFGESVDIDGDTIVVGSRWFHDPWRSGRAFVFTRSGESWVQQQVLSADDAAEEDYFGMAVGISGDTIVVSAVVDDHSGYVNAGSAYVFGRTGESWSFQQKLTPTDPCESQEFGWSADISEDTIIVGSHSDDHSGYDQAGAAYIFVREDGTWSEEAKLTSSRPADGDKFGWDVAISGEAAIVATSGSYRHPDPITSALHIFTKSDTTWGMQRAIVGFDLGLSAAWIAWSIDIDNGLIAMPAWDPDAAEPAIRLLEVLPGPEQVVMPVVARLQGAGAFFTSRWNLLNAGAEDMEIELTYTPRQDFGGPQQTASYTLPAGELQEIVDPLAGIFGITEDAVGSVMINVTEGSVFDLLTQSVVFARQDDGSEFGQFFPAALMSDGLLTGEVAHLCTTEDAEHNRVNFGVMALEDGTRVTVRPVDPMDEPLAEAQTITLDAGGSRQLNRVHQVFGLGTRSGFLLQIEVESGSALAYTSVLDGNGDYVGTSDPTTILPVVAGATSVALLEVGPVQGIDEFSGSATIVNLSSAPAEVRAEFYTRGESGVAATTTLDLAAGETVGYSDVVGDLFGIQNAVGTVMLESENGAVIAAVAREFAIFRGASDETVGTAGQLMDGLTATDVFWPEITYQFIGLRSTESAGGIERSHVAVFNLSEEALTARFTMFGSAGEEEGSIQKTVGAGKLMQYNHILDLINSSQDGEVKRLKVTLSDFAWVRVFRVNSTGDPITIEPFVR